jgi:hypothetical protein
MSNERPLCEAAPRGQSALRRFFWVFRVKMEFLQNRTAAMPFTTGQQHSGAGV